METISLFERLELIQTIFGLEADDTRMNREGRLSKRYVELLEHQAKYGRLILRIVGIGIFLVSVLVAFNTWIDSGHVDMLVARLFHSSVWLEHSLVYFY